MTTEYMPRQQGRIAYDIQGQGPLILCWPSLGDVRGEYRLLAPQLAAAGYRVATCDLRGLGESSVAWSSFDVSAIADDMLALIEQLGGPATIIGTSMSAGAAVIAAAQRPELVENLVLVGAFVRNTMPLWIGKLLMPLFSGPWGAAVWGWYYATLYPTHKPADFASYQAALTANLREPGRLAAVRKMFTSSKAASEAALAQVRARTLVVMGARDPDFKQPAVEAAWIGEQLQGTVVMIEGAGHYPHAEMPEQMLPHVLSFLQHQEAQHGA